MNFLGSALTSHRNQQVNHPELRRQAKYTSKLSYCRVCGDKARYIHYGGLVCLSCKTFFRRYASYPKNSLQCYFNQNCPITLKTRKSCTACRFYKCLAVGMSLDLIRKEDSYRFHLSKYIQPASQLSTLNLLNTDQSSLSLTDWRLVSNVVHAFDNFIPIQNTRQTIEYLSTCPSDISHILSMFTNFYTSTESFIGSSADFQILTVAEKCSLYQRNLHGVLHLCATVILRLSGMFDSSLNDKILISTYDYNTFHQTKRIALELDYDLTIIKLVLFILAFSSNCYIVEQTENLSDDKLLYGTFRLMGSQNVYVDVLWKYMLYRYDYYNASLRFAKMIKHMLDLLKLSENAQQNNQLHQDFLEEITVLTEKSLIIHENDVVPLWGKTEN